MNWSALEELFRIEGQGMLYLPSGWAPSGIAEARGWSELRLDAPGSSLVEGSSSSQAIALPAGAAGRSVWGLPQGTTARRIEVILTLPDGLLEGSVIAGWGSGASSFVLEWAASGRMKLRVGGSVVASIPVGSAGEFHHLGAEIDGDGHATVYADGLFVTGDVAGLFPEDDSEARLQVLANVSMAGLAVAPSGFDRGSLAERLSVISERYAVSGYAALSDGAPASIIAIRRVLDRRSIALCVPGDNGAFRVVVPAGLYEVTCFGGQGYLPELIDQVAAEAIA